MLRRLAQRTGTVAVGTGVGQGLVILATPLLARMYAPEAFGTLALLVTVGNVAMTTACLRYDVAIPSADERDVRGLFVACLLGAAVLAGLAAVGVAFASRSPRPSSLLGGLAGRPALVGATIFLVGVYQASGAWLLRSGSYRGMAWIRATQGAAYGLLAASRAAGLLWAHALSFAAGAVPAWRALKAGGGRSWREAAVTHRQFPLYGLPGAALDVVGYSAAVWVIAAAYGRAAAGEYSQVQRLVGAPLMLLSLSLGQVMLRQTAELAHERARLRALLARTLLALLALSAAGLLALAAAGAPALRAVLGPGWRIDRELVVLVGLAVFVRACVSPLSVVLLTLRRFRLALAWQAAYFVSALTLLPWVASVWGFERFVRFYAAHELVFYGAYLALISFAVRDG